MAAMSPREIREKMIERVYEVYGTDKVALVVGMGVVLAAQDRPSGSADPFGLRRDALALLLGFLGAAAVVLLGNDDAAGSHRGPKQDECDTSCCAHRFHMASSQSCRVKRFTFLRTEP